MFGSPNAGLSFFKDFFTNFDDFLYLLRNTLVMNVATIIQNLVLSVFFAIMLQETIFKKMSKITQTVSFFPFFISWVIGYSIVHTLFSGTTGLLNNMLLQWGIIEKPLEILTNKNASWPLIISLNAWKFVGYNTVIFITSIIAIPAEQYEAALIDGAKRRHRIFYITLPNIMPTIIILLIMNSGWVLTTNFEQFFLFTNSLNWETMEVFDMYIYKFGLRQLNYSYATAIGIIKTIVSLIVLVSVNGIAKKSTGKGIM